MKEFILNLYQSKLGKTAVWAGIFIAIKLLLGFDYAIIAFASAFASNSMGVPIEFPTSRPMLKSKPTHTSPFTGIKPR